MNPKPYSSSQSQHKPWQLVKMLLQEFLSPMHTRNVRLKPGSRGGAGSQPGVSRHRNTVAGGRVGARAPGGGATAFRASGLGPNPEQRSLVPPSRAGLVAAEENAKAAEELKGTQVKKWDRSMLLRRTSSQPSLPLDMGVTLGPGPGVCNQH